MVSHSIPFVDVPMSNHATSGETDSTDERWADPGVPSAVQSTETYQTEEGTVFYDAQNPLAWLQTESAVRLNDRV